MSTFKRAGSTSVLSTIVSIAATVGALAFAGTASAGDTYVGGAWAVRTTNDLNCAAGAACEKASKSSGKIFAGYDFSTTTYSGFNLTQGVEAMAYQIGDTKATFATGAGAKNGTGNSSGTGMFYKLDFGNENYGFITRIGATYAHSSVDFAAGGRETENAWFAPAVGLGARYSVTKNISLTADWDRLPAKFSSSNSEKSVNNMFSIGMSYKF